MLPLKDHNPTFTTPFVTYALVVINSLVMLYQFTLPPLEQQAFSIRHGFIPARIAQLNHPQATLEVPVMQEAVLRNGQIVQEPIGKVVLAADTIAILFTAFTCMFLHGGLMHLVGNMWFLFIFGNNIEDRLGHALYLAFYLVGGLLATACHWAYDPSSSVPVIGASGAVSTILGAYAVTFPKATVSTLIFYGFITIIEVPAIVWLLIWLGGQLFSALQAQDLGVAVWAHIGGFAAGALLMPILSFAAPPPGMSWSQKVRRHFDLTTPPDERW
jgi:membrane associated rhomboid family serine protease